MMCHVVVLGSHIDLMSASHDTAYACIEIQLCVCVHWMICTACLLSAICILGFLHSLQISAILDMFHGSIVTSGTNCIVTLLW